MAKKWLDVFSYTHIAKRSDGKTFKNGVETAETFNQINNNSGTIQIRNVLIDELVVSPATHTDTEILAWYTANEPFQDTVKFTWTPNSIWEDEHNYNILETEFENGRKQFREKSPGCRRFSYEFIKGQHRDNDARDILNFFKAMKGRLKPFLIDYYNVDGTTTEMTVRFATNQLSRQIVYNTVYSFTLPFEEVIE